MLRLPGGRSGHILRRSRRRNGHFQEGISGYTGSSSQSYNYDGGTGGAGQLRLDVPNSYAVLYFDNIFGSGAGQIPANGDVLSATIDGRVSNEFGSATLYRLLQDVGNRPMNPSVITDGAGTFYDDSFGANAAHTAMVANIPSDPNDYGSISFDITDIVQQWQLGADNFGILVLPDTTNGGNIVPPESSLSDFRPLLSVEFEERLALTPEPASLVLGSVLLVLGGLFVYVKRRVGMSAYVCRSRVYPLPR